MFKEIDPKNLDNNVFSLLGDQWTIVSAGNKNNFNGMTASWGGMGVLFHKNVATIYVRPQRYTWELIEAFPEFTLSFFDRKYRPALKLYGSKSGRDVNKIQESGLTPVMDGDTAPYFEEAELVLICRKLYYQDLNPVGFVDTSLQEFYEKKDYHRMYIGEIRKILHRT